VKWLRDIIGMLKCKRVLGAALLAAGVGAMPSSTAHAVPPSSPFEVAAHH
jgi:hypothetical protein